MPGLIAALSLIQTLMIAALSVAREREQGTFDQLLVTPFTPMQLLIGKAIPSILVGLALARIGAGLVLPVRAGALLLVAVAGAADGLSHDRLPYKAPPPKRFFGGGLDCGYCQSRSIL